jgi:DNA-binding NtrC family response regulator
VYSEPGIGTTFKIYLPLIDQAVSSTEKPQRIDAASIVGGTETILVADDDAALRKLTSTVLADFGYHVITASDGMEAIQKFNEHKKSIKLVILDVIMPKKNGKETYQELASLAPGLRAIFMSGYPEGLLDGKEMQGENMAFLLKPILPTDMLRKVRQLLDSTP